MKIQIIMDTFTFFIIFVIIFFLYVHIIAQYKKSEDLEIYEMNYTTNQALQEICEIKQPVLFRLTIDDPIQVENLSYKNDVRVFTGSNASSYVLLPFPQFHNLVNTATKPHYYMEKNRDFIDDVGLYYIFRELDPFLKPYYTAQTIYDIWMGGRLMTTPLRYHINYRQFIYVTSGKIHVKMTPYKSRKYLHPIADYENFDFRSPVNPFYPQPEYQDDMDKLKFLDFDVHAGYVLYIPPYWWYSIQYASESSDKKDTVIMSVIYNSTMNILANSPSIARYYMQLQNTKNIILKTLDIEDGSQTIEGDIVLLDEEKKENSDIMESIRIIQTS